MDALPSNQLTQQGSGGGGRRGSFLFRCESDECSDQPAGLTGSSSTARLTSLVANQIHETHAAEDQLIVTPFAQILHRLQMARSNYSQLTNVASAANSKRAQHVTFEMDASSTHRNHVQFPDDATRELAVEILNEIDWCLDQLEHMQTHRSVSDMTTNKFKRLLNRELNQLAVSSKSGSQISEYIHNTFLETDVDAEAESGEEAKARTGDNAARNHENQRCQATSMMSRISGVRRARSTSTSGANKDAPPPTYGVEDVPDSILVEPMMALDQWGIDIFSLDSLAKGHSIVAITYTVLKERDMLNKFQLSANTLLTYLTRVEDHYRHVPYHNHVHAADVTQSIHSLLSIPALQNVFTDVEVLGVILACAVHDVDHPGVTNQYLINTGSELALMYNDESVLENHHLAVAFKLLQEDQCDVFEPLPTKTRQRLRRIIIDLVLATDMSKHMSLLADLKTMVETKKVAGSGALLLDSYTNRMQVLQNMIHCADLSNPTKPLQLYRQWTDRIMQEFFEQGDVERQLGLDISPMCDRHTATVEKSQVGFIDFVVHPLWETWADLVHPFCAELLDVLEDNRQWYSSRIASSSSGSSLSGAASAQQVSSPAALDSPGEPPSLQTPAAVAPAPTAEDGPTLDVAESGEVDAADGEVQFIVTRHPDGIPPSLTMQRSMSRGPSQSDDRCPHPEMAARRVSETAPGTAAGGTEIKVEEAAANLRGCLSENAVNGAAR